MPAHTKCVCSKCKHVFRGRGGKCESCEEKDAKLSDSRRGTANQRGYNYKWRKLRGGYLLDHPLCVLCKSEGIITSANIVDHVVPHKGDQKLFWNKRNWQSLCKRHHDIKTATEDGGFGRRQARR